jgi:hypothetical protein
MTASLTPEERGVLEIFLSAYGYGPPRNHAEAGWRAARAHYTAETERLCKGLAKAIALLDSDVFDRSEIEPLRALAVPASTEEQK